MRRGVTLIELLITMAIMAILSAAILGTASAAMEHARRSRTQQLITKIHGLLLESMANYEVRRVEIQPTIQVAIDNIATPHPTDLKITAQRNSARGQIMADARLLALRETMKMEMPDTVEDIQHVPLMLSSVPAATRTYQSRYSAAQSAEHDSAECLYMTVMAMTADGEARTLFAKQDIGDVDEDGASEFLDGWGQPIRWMRWAPGIVSDLQPVVDRKNLMSDEGITDEGVRPRDPFDAFSRDREITSPSPPISQYPPQLAQIYQQNILQRYMAATGPAYRNAFKLVPLIYSIGPDGESAYLVPSDPKLRPLDPFQILTDGNQVGAPDPAKRDVNKDNLTNHAMAY